VPPGGGAPQVWFQDPRLFGYFTGAAGIRIDPSGRYLYFAVALSQIPLTPGAGIVYRLPLTAHPSITQLQEVFRYPAGSMPFGLAFGASGKLYVALGMANQISILRPDANGQMHEEHRFPSPADNARRDVPYDYPMGIAFDGCGSLLVTNSNALSSANPAHWAIFDVFVGDTAAPLAHPVIGGVSVPQPPALACHATGAAPHSGSANSASCLAQHPAIRPRGIGPLTLGDTRKRMLSRVAARPVRRQRNVYSWCVNGGTGLVTAIFGRTGRSQLLISTAPARGARGVRPGVAAGAFERTYPRRSRLAPGLWSIRRGSSEIVGISGGRVRFVGVADRSLTRQPRLLTHQLRRAAVGARAVR